MAAPQVDGVPRALARFNAVRAEMLILRNVHGRIQDDEAPRSGTVREVSDRHQLRGAPVIVLKTPSWPREDWAVPQRRRVRP